MNIILCGYKTCGKTTLAKAYSDAYGCQYIDTDDLIIEKFQSINTACCTIGDIHRELGEESFRVFEFEALQAISTINNAVIATGGGVVLNPNSVACLKSLGRILYIDVDKATLKHRLLALKVPPSFISQDAINDDLTNYLNSRDKIYQSVSDYVIDANNKSIQELVSEIYQYRYNDGQ